MSGAPVAFSAALVLAARRPELSMTKPFASILVPTYNQAQYLGAALDSILSQTDPSWEAIVVDDGSTDATPEVIARYSSLDGRIKAFRKQNGGVASALNMALDHATGDWIHWLSSDDMFEPHKLSVNRRWISAQPSCKFFFSYFTLLRDSTSVLEKRDLWGSLPSPDHQILGLFQRNYISGITICVEREAWRRVGGFDERLYYAQDYDQWLRLLRVNQAIFIPEFTVVNRNHAAQGSEVFPDACYFDTAKAAIQFINACPFPSLVPFADLSTLSGARSAVEKALAVAADPTAFLYGLGPHPALLLRTFEWTCSDAIADPVAKAVLRSIVNDRIREQASAPGTDPWRMMWRDLAAAISTAGAPFRYRPIASRDLGSDLHAIRQARRDPSTAALATYLQRFEGLQVANACERPAQSRIVLLPPRAVSTNFDEIEHLSKALAAHGHYVTTVADRYSGYEWDVGGNTRLPRGTEDRDILPWVGEADLLVTSDEEASLWISARDELRLPPGGWASSQEVLEQALSSLTETSVPATPPRPVVFLQRVRWGGGAERVVSELVAHLDRRRYRPIVVTLFREEEADHGYPADVQVICLAEFFERHGLAGPLASKTYFGESTSARTSRIGQALASHLPNADGLRLLLSHLGPNVALITVMEEATVAAWMAGIKGDLPYLASLHTLQSNYLPQMYPDAARLGVEHWAFSNACRSARRVVFPSLGCKDDLVREFRVDTDLVDVIGNPIDCARIRRRASAPLRGDAELFDARFAFAHVARLDPVKGHDLLFAACQELLRRRDDFQVLCIGDGPAAPALRAEIQRRGLAGSVVLLGARTNPFPIVARADAALLTSRFESFALVLAEALALAKPVISVDCPYGPREVLDSGRYGLLVEADDPIALAAAMERLIVEPELRADLSRRGPARAKDFDVGSVVRTWEQAIDEVLPPQPAETHEPITWESATPAQPPETESDLGIAEIPTETLAEELASRLETMPGNPLHDLFYRRGFHLLRKHFYLPVPDDTDRLDEFWTRPSQLAGVDMNDAVPLGLMKEVFPPFLKEFRDRFPIYKQQEDNPEFHLINGGYMAVDAHVYYSLIRRYQPRRIIEIGVGNSTLLAIAANAYNERDGRRARLTSVDPYPWDLFRGGYPGLDELVDQRVQDVPLSTFEALEANDILFIDSSHVIRSGNDVHFEFLEVLPRLKPGVLVHVHDISLPKPYPKVYFDNHLYWNEQYLLQAFLMFNKRFEVIWPGNYMMVTYPDRVLEVFPEMRTMREHYPQSEPSAFWMRVKN